MKNFFLHNRFLLCLALSIGVLVAGAQPKASFKADVVEGCSPLVVKFTDLTQGNPASWKWDLGNGISSTLQDPGAIYITPGFYTIKLIASNAKGNDTVVKTDLIKVYGLPEVSFSTNATTGCAPFSVQFKNTTKPVSGLITSSVWDFGDGQISTELEPRHFYGFSDTFSVALTVTNAFGCKSSLQKKDLIKVPPEVTSKFDYSYTNLCQVPAKIDFHNLSVSKSKLTYTWRFGDGSTAGSESPGHTFTTGGEYDVQLISKTEYGCLDTFVRKISIGSVKADFNKIDSVCANEILFFDNTSSSIPTDVLWDFGDGENSTDITTYHSFKDAGTYKVTMSADFGGCSATVTKSVTVTNKPKASFSTTGKLISCALPLPVKFNNTSNGGIAYKWEFGDGETSKEENPSHNYNKPGIFSVNLIVFNANGCSDTITNTDLVQTVLPEILALNGLPFKGCAPSTVKFSSLVQSSEPVTSYLWKFGDGTQSTLAEPSHIYNNTGKYDVTLKISSAGGCTHELKVAEAVELGIAPKSHFSARPLSTCAALQVSFFDETQGEVNEWRWEFGDGTASTQQNPSHLYKDTGVFDITLIAMNNNCADTLTIEKYVEVFPPIAEFAVKLNCKTPYVRNFIDKSIGAATWLWDFGDGQTSTTPSPQHTYSAPGRYGVSLKVTNNVCEFVKYDSVFIVDENPSFTYKAVSEMLCKYDSVSFTATNYKVDAVSKLSWIFGDGTISELGSAEPGILHQYAIAGLFNPVLIATDINGCNDTVNQHLSISFSGPAAAFTNVPYTCINNNIKFNDASATDGIHPIVSWRWEYGDGTLAEQTSKVSDHTYTQGGSFNVKLIVLDSFGCSDSLQKNNAVLIANPIAKFIESDTLTCSNSIIDFRSLSTGSALKYSWSFGDGETSALAKLSHDYSRSGVYTVKLSILDKYGCRDSITKADRITISNPSASFILNDTVGICPPLLIEPQNTSKNYSSVYWEFGDSSNTTLYNPQHYYGTAGSFVLKLIAKGYGNCYDTAIAKVRVKGPSGTLRYSRLTGCTPTSVTFSSTAKNVAEFVWDFNNGVVTHTTDTIIKYSYDAYGSYLPKLVLIDAEGCKVSVENKDRIVISDINAGLKQLKNNGKLYCDSAMFEFNDSSKAYFDDIKTYKWNFGDNQSLSSKNPVHYYNKSGVYNVSLKVVSAVGCTDSIEIPVNVSVNKSPKISVNATDSVCELSPVKFYAGNSTADNTTITWKWSFGDGSFDDKQNVIYAYPEGGSYDVSLTATSSNGCAIVKKIPVIIYKNPKVSAGADTSVCYGNALTLRGTGADRYTWLSNPGLSCTNCATPFVKPESSAWYVATGISQFGCKATDSVFVKVYTPFKVSASTNNVLCIGQSISLKASGTEIYQWTPQTYLDNPNAAAPTFTATAPADITYTVIGKDSRNCFSDTSKVTVKVYPVPTIEVLEKIIVTNAGFPVKLNTVSSADVTKWSWTPATGLDSPFAASPTSTPKNNITYQVVATNEGNCSTSAALTLTVLCDGRNIFVPNTFSPNGDGMNDMFFPRGRGVFNVKSMRIFNRWGTMVFEKMNFSANTASEGWNGTYQGKKQSLDVYVYMMEVLCENGTVNRINGNVALLQ